MFFRALPLFLTILVPNIYSEEIDDFPVDLLDSNHIEIRKYSGPLNAETVQFLKNVEVLELRSSNFTPLDQSFLLPLTKLTKLKASHCHVDLKQHDISSCCKNIKEFELINSGLLSIDLNVVSTWPLEKINWFRENIPKLEAKFLSNPQLKHLSITGSNIESIDDAAFSKLEQLETLDLERNKIKQITKAMLTPLKNVKKINLEKNLLEKLTVDMFPPMPNLEKLFVGHNPVKEFNLAGLKALAPKLKEVDVSEIEGIDPSKSGDLPLVSREIAK